MSVRRSKRVGKLAILQEMPLDVLFEIFALLHPYDLLRISRTTKTLRRLLMTRSARATWINALASVPDLPHCPEDMSEPAWARLAFEPMCHICETSSVHTIYWCLRLRACAKCLDETNSVFVKMNKYYVDAAIKDSLLGSYRIPWEQVRGRRGLNDHVLFLKNDLDNIQVALKQRAGDPVQERLVETRTEKTKIMREHSLACIKWHEEQKDQRRGDIAEIRGRRKGAIFDHLRGLGYGREIKWMEQTQCGYGSIGSKFNDLKGVKQPKDLTVRVWNNIRPEIVAFMDGIRPSCEVDMELRTLKQRLQLLVSALKLHNPPYMPRVLDLYSLDIVREVLDQPLEDDEDTVTMESFTIPLSNFASVMEHCRAMRVSEALQALRKCDDATEDLNEDHLTLATSVFRCSTSSNHSYGTCRARLANARELTFHRCGRANSITTPWEEDWKIRERQEQLKLVLEWIEDAGGKGTTYVDKAARARVARLVELADLDPRTATSADMDEVSAWFKCSSSLCFSNRDVTAFNWRQAGEHSCSIYYMTRMTSTEEEKARAIAASLGISLPQAYDTSEIWSCVHCSKSHMASSEFRLHCRSVHGIIAPVHGTDFIMEDCFLPPSQPVVIKLDDALPA